MDNAPEETSRKDGKAEAIAIGLSFMFLTGGMAILKELTLHSTLCDLGLFDSLFYNVIHQGKYTRIFFGHAHPLALFYVPFLALLPEKCWPGFLVGSQAVLISLSLWHIRRTYGRIPGIVYMLYAPVWINLLFDFHFDYLAIPILTGFYFGIKAGKPYMSMLWGLLLMLVKEPFALQTSACGIFLIWTGVQHGFVGSAMSGRSATKQSDWVISGCVLAVAGFLYFLFATYALIPYFTPGSVHAALDSSAFSWLGHGLWQMIVTIVTHPFLIIKDIMNTPGKPIYLFVVFGLLGFVPLLAPLFLIPALPLLAIAMLSHLSNYYDYNTHYTAGLIVPLMLAFIHGRPRAENLWMALTRKVGLIHPEAFFTPLLLGWILAGHVVLSPSPISRLFWSAKVWGYNWRSYVPTDRETMMKAAMAQYIPADSRVSVSAQNTVNWYYLAHRQCYVPFPQGVDAANPIVDTYGQTFHGFWRDIMSGRKPMQKLVEKSADFVVIDIHRPWFWGDKGCDWLYGTCRNLKVADKFIQMVDSTQRHYVSIFSRDGFMIFRRR